MANENGWGDGVLNNDIGWGQGADNNNIGWGSVYGDSSSGLTALEVGFTGLLDTYTGASAAYSVRKLSSTYTGAALRVRRSSDNSEQDISFVGQDLDTESMLTFCGVGNGFVVTWYDQSGNSEHITQVLAASQPLIVTGGSLILSNSKPSIEFGGTTTTALTATLSTAITQPSTYFRVFENNGALGVQRHFVEISDPTYVIGQTVANVITQYAGSFLSGTTTIVNSTQYLHSGLFNTTSSQIRLNSSTEATGNNGALTTVTNLYMGGNSLSNLYIGKAQEYIIYNENNSADFSAIEANINNYYSVF